METYEAIINSWGHEVLATAEEGDYQGEIFALLRSADGRLGFVDIGYGSCSGCDALQDALYSEEDPQAAVAALSASLEAGIRWEDSADALADWARASVESPKWWSGEELATVLSLIDRGR
jgi:DNA-binding NarL/FixJ family response regulator